MTTPLLEMHDVTKRFPGVLALDKARLELHRGEIHCLLGENGAGKSTLMRILAGALEMDEGIVRIDGEAVELKSPLQAQALGIAMIHQEFNLCPHLTVAENIYLGREPKLAYTPFIDRGRMRRGAEALLAQVNAHIDVGVPASELSTAQQQLVEICKALSMDAKLIIYDEPSAALSEREIERLFALMAALKSRGIGQIYISHRLEEIRRIGDRLTVMRDGKYIATQNVADTSRDEIIHMMVGRTLAEEFPKHGCAAGRTRLRVEGLSREGAFQDVSFSVREGEIVGLTGLVGAGRTEVARALFGADRHDSGAIYLDDEQVTPRSPRDAIAHGIALLTEDRKAQGLVLGMTVAQNITLAKLSAVLRGPFINRTIERRMASDYVGDLRIKTPNVNQVVRNLSGGNQQKVVLAKWLLTNSKVVIFDEPTRGVDVGGKTEIYRLINRLVEQGVGVLMISSELPEILGLCDRIIVMHEGRVAGELNRTDATQEKIMQLATGGGAN